MRKLLVPAAIAAILATSPFALAATQAVNGVLKTYDQKAMTITLADGSVYMLPKAFKDPGLKAGEKLNISWEQSGKHKLADKVMIVK